MKITSTTANRSADFWLLQLRASDSVKVNWGSTPSAVSDFEIFPDGTTDETRGTIKTLLHDVNWKKAPLFSSTFEAKDAGTYPIAFYCGGACQQAGSFSFTIDVLHKALLYVPRLTELPQKGTLKVFARDAAGAPISDQALTLKLVGTWRDAAYVPASPHVLARGSPKSGAVVFAYRVPAELRGKRIRLQVDAAGKSYAAISTPSQIVRVTA
jgi:hypothetical protein